MKCLENITFTSNSDAHSEGPQSLGREFNRFEIEEPSFEEIVKAFKRQNGRKITLNVGLEPRLGKYPLIFCKDCRYRVQVFLNSQVPKEIQGLTRINTLTDSFAIDDKFVYYFFDNELQINNLKKKIIYGKILCEGCKKLNKKSKLVLGVFDRIGQIADYKEPKHPPHRPPYLDIVPLVEMLRVLYKVKSVNAKTVINEYEKLIKKYGSEFKILTDDDILPQLKREGYQNLADLIAAFKNKSITFIPGGGGIYGEISFENME
jgi:PHP family Zn ribbon phosphoesterase